MHYIILVLSVISLISYLVILFLLFEIKMRIEGKTAWTLIFMMVAVILAIITRIINLLGEAGYFIIPYLHESLVVLFSLFLLFAVINFYKAVSEVTDRKIKSSVLGGDLRKKDKKINLQQNFRKSKTIEKETFPKKSKQNFISLRKKTVYSGEYLDLTKK